MGLQFFPTKEHEISILDNKQLSTVHNMNAQNAFG